jgi:hypothetical protein
MRIKTGTMALVAAAFLLAATTSVAYSQPQRAARFSGGEVNLTINGRGSVTLSKGFNHPVTLSCNQASCLGTHVYETRHLHVSMSEKPHKGWKFAGWSGFCKNKTRTCAIDFSRVPTNTFGLASTHVRARFIR